MTFEPLVLGDSLEVLIDNRGKNPPYALSGVPVVSGMSVRPDGLDLGESKCATLNTWQQWMPSPTRIDDVIMTSEAPLGRVALVRSSEPMLIAQRVFGMRGRAGVLDSRFLYYALQTTTVQADLASRATGSTVLGIRQPELRKVLIPAPDFVHQRAIAAVLGALDDKIAANERIATTAFELGDQLFLRSAAKAVAVRKTIGELADSSVIEFSDGYRTKKSEHGQPGLRILRGGDVRGSYVYPSGQDYVSLDYARQIGSKVSAPGDVVLTTKGTVGRVAVVAPAVEKVVYSPQVCFFRVKEDSEVDSGYLAGWFRSADLQRQAAMLMYKSDMAPYISLRDIRSLVIPLPALEEQRRQGEIQRSLLASFEAGRVENERLADTRDELLPLLMSGKVTVKAAEELVGGVT